MLNNDDWSASDVGENSESEVDPDLVGVVFELLSDSFCIIGNICLTI